MHFRNVLDQHLARLEAFKDGTCPLALTQHAHQDHVGVTVPYLQATHRTQCSEQSVAFIADICRLGSKHIGMFQRKQCALVVQHADVVGRAHLVDLINQRLVPHHVANAHAGQSELAQGAHEQHMGMGLWLSADYIQIGVAGERLVGLVHDHDAARLARCHDDARNAAGIPQVGRGIVGVGQIDDGGLLLRNGSQHGGLVQCKVRRQWHAHKVQTLQLGTHGVHHKARHRRQHHGT